MDETGKQAAENRVLTRVGYCVCTLLPILCRWGMSVRSLRNAYNLQDEKTSQNVTRCRDSRIAKSWETM